MMYGENKTGKLNTLRQAFCPRCGRKLDIFPDERKKYFNGFLYCDVCYEAVIKEQEKIRKYCSRCGSNVPLYKMHIINGMLCCHICYIKKDCSEMSASDIIKWKNMITDLHNLLAHKVSNDGKKQIALLTNLASELKQIEVQKRSEMTHFKCKCCGIYLEPNKVLIAHDQYYCLRCFNKKHKVDKKNIVELTYNDALNIIPGFLTGGDLMAVYKGYKYIGFMKTESHIELYTATDKSDCFIVEKKNLDKLYGFEFLFEYQGKLWEPLSYGKVIVNLKGVSGSLSVKDITKVICKRVEL